MPNILIASSAMEAMAELTDFMARQDAVSLSLADGGSAALERVTRQRFDLVVMDETLADMSGLELARRLVVASPMANLALVSSLPAEAFHEASEGLGVLAQLPPSPGAEQSRELLAQLDRILNMTAPK